MKDANIQTREFILTKEDIEKALLKYIAEDIKRDDIYLIRYKIVGDEYVRVKVGIKNGTV